VIDGSGGLFVSSALATKFNNLMALLYNQPWANNRLCWGDKLARLPPPGDVM
jgi:hypothetical protein